MIAIIISHTPGSVPQALGRGALHICTIADLFHASSLG
jgi:hypothetical protein